MKIYLLVENDTNRVLKAYKYVDVAVTDKSRNGVAGEFNRMFNGKDSSNQYRIEVLDVIE